MATGGDDKNLREAGKYFGLKCFGKTSWCNSVVQIRRRQGEGKPPAPSSPLQVPAAAIPGVPQSTAAPLAVLSGGPAATKRKHCRIPGEQPPSLCLPRAALLLPSRSRRLALDFPKQFAAQIGGEVPPGEEKLRWSSCLRVNLLEYYDEKRKKEGADGERTLLSALADLFALVSSRENQTGVIDTQSFMDVVRDEYHIVGGYTQQA
ncbi:hypothetical protein Drorol1_Dr00001245 [Drosera rotundifolia]